MKLRMRVLRRAGGFCERCQMWPADEVHHLNGVEDNHPEALLAVCRRCHLALEAEKRG
jgi:hypothetical protein